jgi:hypothetical protein
VRTAVCLLSLLLSFAVARAAPAPFAKGREVTPPFSTDLLKKHLCEHHRVWAFDRVEQRGPREWLVVCRQGNPWSQHGARRRAYVVQYHGKGHDGSPNLTLIELDESQVPLRA